MTCLPVPCVSTCRERELVGNAIDDHIISAIVVANAAQLNELGIVLRSTLVDVFTGLQNVSHGPSNPTRFRTQYPFSG